MKKIASVLLFGILCPVLMFGQGETSNWYFGNGAGIQFNNDGSITPTKNGQLNTFEGCATISDAVGNLLFYTDGITVYNSDHQIMDNGEELYGDPSSTQSALIIPKPEDPFIFYIFTVDTSVFEGDPDFGLNYSIVDMSLNKNLGAVTEKNINLLSDCSEKITAVIKDCFEQSIWVTTLASANSSVGTFNTYHAFEVTSEGVMANSVKSTIQNLNILDPRGYLKFSPDGTKLASANSTNGLFLYDFDDKTGTVSNQLKIEIDDPNKSPYGIEFSPDSRFLYVHSSNDVLRNTGHSSSLLQYDLTAADIRTSMVLLDQRAIFRGALQQAENGKIYRTIARSYTQGTPYLGVINSPNEKGVAADYVHDAVYLDGKNATQGLPPFIQSFFSKTELIRNEDGTSSSTLILCSGDPFTLAVDMIPGATYEWEKDGVPLNVPGNTLYEVVNSDVDHSGRYRLVITLPNPMECPIVGESQIKVLPIPDAIIPITKCDIDEVDTTDGITRINLEQINDNPDIEFFYYNSTADRDNDTPITDIDQYQNTQAFNQTLYYKAINNLACINFGEIQIQVEPVVIAPSPHGPFYDCDEIPDDSVLESTFNLNDIAENYQDIIVNFYASLADMSLQENVLTGSITTASTTIYARMGSENQCLGIEEIQLVVNPSPVFEMPSKSYLLCTDNPSLAISAPAGFDDYRWIKLGDTGNAVVWEDPNAVIRELGTYLLEVAYNYTINGVIFSCTASESFEVLPSNRAIIQDIEIKDFSNNNTIQIEVTGDGSYTYSLDGLNYQTSNFFDNIEPGFVTVYVKDSNGCGITEKEIAVMGYPKFFTPNGDGINDYWQLTGVEKLLEEDAFISIYDRYGGFVTQISPNDLGWNGAANAKSLPASDYWFRIDLKDGREFKGHFALKR